MTQDEMFLYDFLVENGIATAEELNLARNLVNGDWIDVLQRVMFIRTQCRTLAEYFNELDEEDE